MLIWILSITVVFRDSKDFFIIYHFEIAECFDQNFGKLSFDNLFPVMQVLIFEMINKLYLTIEALISEYLHDILVETLLCWGVFMTCWIKVYFQFGLIEVNNIALVLTLNCFPDKLI